MSAALPKIAPVRFSGFRTAIKPTKSGLYLVFLWKDQIDASAPMWKQVFYRAVQRPFLHFCKHVLKMPTCSGEYEDGRLCWLEFQGIVSERWQAEQAARNQNWGYALLPLDSLLPAETLPGNTDHNYPLTDDRTRARYQRNGKPTIEVSRTDAIRLAGKLAQTDSLVEQYRMKAT